VRITNSQIANSQWADQGEGAHFHYRYVGRRLTDQLLWPWPMEERIVNETGVSVNEIGINYAKAEGVILTVAPTVMELERNGSAEVTVNVDVFGNIDKPVSLNVRGSGSGLSFAPAAATVNAVAEWTFNVTAPDMRGIHELTITASAEEVLGAERKLIIFVDPQKLFLPAVSSGQR
jgi:hypothetical protein